MTPLAHEYINAYSMCMGYHNSMGGWAGAIVVEILRENYYHQPRFYATVYKFLSQANVIYQTWANADKKKK